MSENYSLERQLLSYQKSLSFASNSNRMAPIGQPMGQRAKSDDYLHDSSLHYMNAAPGQHTQAFVGHTRGQYDERHSVGGGAQSPYGSDFA